MGQIEDRRIRRTKRMLLQSLIQLMAKKKINQISVTELTKMADVNRSTFYLYYKDIFDMLFQIETKMFENFKNTLKKYMKTDATYEDALNFFIYIFEFVKKNADMFKILLGPDGDYSFMEKFKKAITQEYPPIGNLESHVRSFYVMPFIVSGSMGIIQQWLEEDMKVPPREMAAFTLKLISCITSGMDGLEHG